MFVRNAWYAAGWSNELGPKPLGRKIMGQIVVLFRDEEGTARALGARCPHRGADLSKGRLSRGSLECPFHGWRFSGLGQCTRIPSQSDTMKIPPAARVPAFRLTERNGILWAWMNDADPGSREPPDYFFWKERRGRRRIQNPPQLLASPFLEAVENQLDLAHHPFIHPTAFGADVDPIVPRYRIIHDEDGEGLMGEEDSASPWKRRGGLVAGWSGRMARLAGQSVPVTFQVRFQLGGVLHRYLEQATDRWDVFSACLTPADENHTWLFYETIRTRAPNVLGDWAQAWWQRTVAAEGEAETRLILPQGSGGSPSRVSVEADRVGLAFRKLYETRAREESAR